MLGSAFIASGLDALQAPTGSADVVQPLASRLSAEPETVVRAAGAVQIAAGAALAVGKAPRLASAVLTGTLVPTALLGGDFWNETDPTRRRTKRAYFMKDLGLLGGVLIAAADTEGRPSLGWRGRRRIAQVRASAAAALPNDSDTASAWGSAVEHAETLAHDIADRVPMEAIKDQASHLAEAARAQTNAAVEAAPGVLERVRDQAADTADEIVARAPAALRRSDGR
ncbi:DoxX family protein [Gordonia neofelifaecis]|uniref:DoxX family protein n=1 Tax=Gordonia neofelifaecis NRRL B-59395 TaxID=644548 RepID=F1YPR2_9ACTN|nr:DoxX family protein [Gordonia neofelifaecis]EGD53341.1 hypothetical protein SCNU_19597 [Gordonia neofelifaecis NRRL B-59395]